jgi:MFS family permease
MLDIRLFRSKPFALGNIAGLMASVGRGGLQFMLIVWLQGIWLPLHGYSFESTPLWSGIYMLPMTLGFLLAGPLSGTLSDRFGSRPFAIGGLVLMAMTFVALTLIPVDFDYRVFAVLIFLNGLGGGIFTSPNTAAIMSSVPATERGAASGIRATFTNAGTSLSIGIFFPQLISGPFHNGLDVVFTAAAVMMVIGRGGLLGQPRAHRRRRRRLSLRASSARDAVHRSSNFQLFLRDSYTATIERGTTAAARRVPLIPTHRETHLFKIPDPIRPRPAALAPLRSW